MFNEINYLQSQKDVRPVEKDFSIMTKDDRFLKHNQTNAMLNDTLSPLDQLNILLKLKKMADSDSTHKSINQTNLSGILNTPILNKNNSNHKETMKEMNTIIDKSTQQILDADQSNSRILQQDLKLKEVLLIDDLPIDLELAEAIKEMSIQAPIINDKTNDNKSEIRTIEEIQSESKLDQSEKRAKLSELNDAQRLYYLQNTISWKESTIKKKKQDLEELTELINEKRKLLKEIKENIFNKEYIREKTIQDQKRVKSEIDDYEMKLKVLNNSISETQLKISKCDTIIENYYYIVDNKGDQEKIICIDDIVKGLKVEKMRLIEMKNSLSNEISLCERKILHLNESLSILEIKNKVN